MDTFELWCWRKTPENIVEGQRKQTNGSSSKLTKSFYSSHKQGWIYPTLDTLYEDLVLWKRLMLGYVERKRALGWPVTMLVNTPLLVDLKDQARDKLSWRKYLCGH